MEPKSYIIGRNVNNDIYINNKVVSDIHARITQLSPNTCLLEDFSSNGTTVDGIKIKRKVIEISNIVKFANIQKDVSKCFYKNTNANQKIKNNYAEFAKLEKKWTEIDKLKKFVELGKIWEEYYKVKKQANNSKLIKNIGFKVTGVVIETWLLPGFFGLAGSFAGDIAEKLSDFYLSKKEKIQALDIEFKNNYVCPNCNKYLGYKPFIKLTEEGGCSYCNYKWSDKKTT